MKMNYPLKNKHYDRRKTIVFSSVPLIFLIIIFGLNFLFPNLLTPVSHVVSVPILALKNKVSEHLGNVFGYFQSKNDLSKENETLRQKLSELEIAILKTNFLIKENVDLKFELGRSSSSQRVLAYVLSGHDSSPYRSILIDIGKVDGIKNADKVYVFGGIPLGYIKEVYSHSSLVALYSSPGEEISVEVPPNYFTTKAYGRGAGSFEVSVPKEIEIEVGDIISLPGIHHEIIGIVESVEGDEAQSKTSVIFRSPFNIYQIEKVYVEK